MWFCGLVAMQVMCQSDNQILRYCFRREEVNDQKRPEMVRIRSSHPPPCLTFSSFHVVLNDKYFCDTCFMSHLQAATQFKNSLMKLMEILMSKEPSYVRCIKPNDAKQPGTGWNMNLECVIPLLLTWWIKIATVISRA